MESQQLAIVLCRVYRPLHKVLLINIFLVPIHKVAQTPLWISRKCSRLVSWLRNAFSHNQIRSFLYTRTMNILHISSIAPAIEAIETVATYGTKVYMFASEIFTISALLWCLNALATGIEKVYNAGYIVGTFYRYHMHASVKEWTIKFIAAVIFVSILFWEGCVVLYTRRNQILANLNAFRNQLGSYFVCQYA